MKNITDQAVTMRSHCDKIDIFLAREPDDLVRRFAEREHRVAGKTFAGQFAAALFQVSAIALHLFAFGELELVKIARHPAIGNVDEEQPRAGHARKRLDMSQNGLVSRSVLERDENVVIHFKNHEARMTKPKIRCSTSTSAASFGFSVCLRPSSFGFRHLIAAPADLESHRMP